MPNGANLKESWSDAVVDLRGLATLDTWGPLLPPSPVVSESTEVSAGRTMVHWARRREKTYYASASVCTELPMAFSAPHRKISGDLGNVTEFLGTKPHGAVGVLWGPDTAPENFSLGLWRLAHWLTPPSISELAPTRSGRAEIPSPGPTRRRRVPPPHRRKGVDW